MFDKVYVIYHVLKHMNTLHVQMAKVGEPKIERTISCLRLRQVYHESIHENCPQYHRHKEDPRVTLKTCRAITEWAKMILV